MNLNYKRVYYGSHHYRHVKQLYTEAFPQIERLPLWKMSLLALRTGIDFYAVYDGGDFCGLLYLLSNRKQTLIFYFAVRDDLRGRGYGAEILKEVHSRKGSVSVIMESMHEACDNPAQRRSRTDFYLRNGFRDTGYYMRSRGIYDILCTEPQIDPGATAKLLRRFMSWFGVEISVEKY